MSESAAASPSAALPPLPEWHTDDDGHIRGDGPIEATLVEKITMPRSLGEALLWFQGDTPQVVKDAEADVMDKTGQRKLYSYKYLTLQALLEAVRPSLSALGLVWTAKPSIAADGKPTLHYTMRFVPTGEVDEGEMPLITGGTMQAYGGALSFGRRYALLTYLNLAPDVDEDGAVATDATTSAGAKPLSKARATKLVELAQKVGDLNRLRLAASTVHNADVGDCDTVAKAVKAMQALNTAEGERLFARLSSLEQSMQASEGGEA